MRAILCFGGVQSAWVEHPESPLRDPRLRLSTRWPLPIRDDGAQHVAKLRHEKAAFPGAANARVNPDGFRARSDQDVAKYEARHPVGPKARLALDLCSTGRPALRCRQTRAANGALVQRDITQWQNRQRYKSSSLPRARGG